MSDQEARDTAEPEWLDDMTLHPEADKFVCPKWDEPGKCICGAVLPPQREWIDAGNPWQRVECSVCGRGYVDEDDFIAIYDEGLTRD